MEMSRIEVKLHLNVDEFADVLAAAGLELMLSANRIRELAMEPREPGGEPDEMEVDAPLRFKGMTAAEIAQGIVEFSKRLRKLRESGEDDINDIKVGGTDDC